MHPAHERFDPARAALLQRLMPAGAPTLWCPLLTHYTAGRHARQGAHAPPPRLPAAGGQGLPHPRFDRRRLATVRCRDSRVARLRDRRSGRAQAASADRRAEDEHRRRAAQSRRHDGLAAPAQRGGEPRRALVRSAVCGFTVCPPKGREMSQGDIRASLDRVLSKGLPVSLYQLPQITENEMAPDTVPWLAERHPNFVMLKDTSGADRVAAAGFRDVFLVRGAEGDYSKHLAISGGAYDGFLLSTANVFGPQLAQIIDDLRQGRRAAGRRAVRTHRAGGGRRVRRRGAAALRQRLHQRQQGDRPFHGSRPTGAQRSGAAPALRPQRCRRTSSTWPAPPSNAAA